MSKLFLQMNKKHFSKLIKILSGDFNNFQQAWQEHTEDDIHRLEVEKKHRHLHLSFEKQFINFNPKGVSSFILKIKENRINPIIIAQYCLEFKEQNCLFYPIKLDGIVMNNDTDIEEIDWVQSSPSKFTGSSKTRNTKITLTDNQLIIQQKDGFFANPTPYHFLKCRYFSGWIEYPNPENPEEIFRMGNLKIHDQGGMIPLIIEDKTQGPYTVELTQLVFAKKLAIMKLAIYEQAFESIDYNSKAISYTWTNPDAKRIGINLRKVISGWTFIEPGYVNSDNTDWEAKE